MARNPTVLVADDQADVRETLRLLLKSAGLASLCVADPAAVLDAAGKREFACALIDFNYRRDTTSGEEGLDLLDGLRRLAPDLPVVAMTAWGNVPLAIEAMRRGAADFIEKPWENARLVSVLRAQIALGEAAHRQRQLEAENALLRGSSDGVFIAESPSMRKALAMLERIASNDANVLLLGESGTGKGLAARFLHDHSPRAARPLVKVNMGAIADSVFESEMFGHVRGAFTDAKSDRVGRFELADGGTLLLDEVGNVPSSQQPKLLRVLEDGEFERLGSSRTQTVDVRLISATNADLESEVAAGRFRKDLLYRLNTLEVYLPALRERSGDILLLARWFLARSARHYHRDQLRWSPAAERTLTAWHWPGNVRELEHVVDRAVLLAEHDEIGPELLNIGTRTSVAGDLDGMTLDQAEARLVQRALERHQRNLQRTADALGISRQSLYRRLEKHGLDALASDGD